MNFKTGETIYHVHALPRSGEKWLDTYIVVKNTTMLKEKVPALLVQKPDKTWKDTISLRDANVIPNTYSCHRIFKTLEAAEAYMADPSQWRPLGFTAEEWANGERAKYLNDERFTEHMFNTWFDEWDDE